MLNKQNQLLLVLGAMSLSLITSTAQGGGDQRLGMSEERKLASLAKLKNYQRLDREASARLSAEEQLRRDKWCEQAYDSSDKYCLEKKYMDGNYYSVDITFYREDGLPTPPKEKLVEDEEKHFIWDSTEYNKFINEWRSPILIDYLGSKYSSYNGEITGMDKNHLSIKVKVLDPGILDSLIFDPRITLLRHVASPPEQLEEIVD